MLSAARSKPFSLIQNISFINLASSIDLFRHWFVAVFVWQVLLGSVIKLLYIFCKDAKMWMLYGTNFFSGSHFFSNSSIQNKFVWWRFNVLFFDRILSSLFNIHVNAKKGDCCFETSTCTDLPELIQIKPFVARKSDRSRRLNGIRVWLVLTVGVYIRTSIRSPEIIFTIHM